MYEPQSQEMDFREKCLVYIQPTKDIAGVLAIVWAFAITVPYFGYLIYVILDAIFANNFFYVTNFDTLYPPFWVNIWVRGFLLILFVWFVLWCITLLFGGDV